MDIFLLLCDLIHIYWNILSKYSSIKGIPFKIIINIKMYKANYINSKTTVRTRVPIHKFK